MSDDPEFVSPGWDRPAHVPRTDERYERLIQASKAIKAAVQAADRICGACGIERPPDELTIPVFEFTGWLEQRALEFLDESVGEER